MSRIKLETPDRFLFAVELTVRISDINYGGHLGNDAVLALLQEARLHFLADKGFSEKDVGGAGLIMTDAAVVYKNQAFHGDRLKIEIAVSDIGRCGFDLHYRMSRTGDGRLIVEAKTGMACFDYQRNRPARVPEAFMSAFGGGLP